MPDLTNTVPSVLKVEPSLSTRVTSSRPTIYIYFSTDMKQDSFNNDTLLNKSVRLLFDDGNAAVSLNYVDYQPSLKRLAIRPSVALGPGLYRLFIDAESSGIRSINGRSLLRTQHYSFKIDAVGSVAETTLSGPRTGAISYDIPELSVTIGSYTLPGTGSVAQIKLEVSESESFSSPLWTGTQSVSGAGTYTLQPSPLVFNTDNSYYWRARFEFPVDELYGEWTELADFYYGSYPETEENSRRILPDDRVFEVLLSGFESGSSHNLEWPELSLYFSAPVDHSITYVTVGTGTVAQYSFEEDLFTITEASVDGGPKSLVEGLWQMSSPTKIVFQPSGSIGTNKRYTITVSSDLKSEGGLSLGESFEAYFTGKYLPLYAYPIQVRAQFGELLSSTSDDLINFHIYRASMEANFKASLGLDKFLSIDPTYFVQNQTLTSQLKDNSQELYYCIHMWVIYEAMIRMLNLKLFEMVEDADGSLQIADFQQGMVSSATLKFLNDKIKELKKEQSEYEIMFSRRSMRPRTGVKSSSLPADYHRYRDIGYRGRKGF